MYRALGSVLPIGSSETSSTYSEILRLCMDLKLDLDAPCGRYLTFRNLIECGETWRRAAAEGRPVDNEPVEAESLDALIALCEAVLDPVVERFGPISITYALAGAPLSRRVMKEMGRVAPKLDQHAAHELNRNGRRVCERGGAATDFQVVGFSSLEVARWIVSNTRFDRLYFYGPDRPIHVSVAVEPNREIVLMRESALGRRVPRVVKKETFLVDDDS
jgi:hypothetical protein